MYSSYSDWVLQLLQVNENPQIDGLFPKCFFQPMGIVATNLAIMQNFEKEILDDSWNWRAPCFFSITVSTIQSNCAHTFQLQIQKHRRSRSEEWGHGTYTSKQCEAQVAVERKLAYLHCRATNFTCFCTCVGQMFFEILWNWYKFSWWDVMHQHPSECLLIPTCKVKSLQGVYIYTGKRPGGSGTMHLKTSRGQSMWVTGKVTSSTAKLSRTPSEVKGDPICTVRFATNNDL